MMLPFWIGSMLIFTILDLFELDLTQLKSFIVVIKKTY